ncbi:MAG: hypothetical protein P8168_00265, partial [Deltaproteobacteria bacterium]
TERWLSLEHSSPPSTGFPQNHPRQDKLDIKFWLWPSSEYAEGLPKNYHSLAVFGNGRFEFHISEVVAPVEVAEVSQSGVQEGLDKSMIGPPKYDRECIICISKPLLSC